MTDEDATEEALCTALDAGYQLIDTAMMYENEHIIGQTLKRRMKQGLLNREDIFITTKVSYSGEFIATSIDRLIDQMIDRSID